MMIHGPQGRKWENFWLFKLINLLTSRCWEQHSSVCGVRSGVTILEKVFLCDSIRTKGSKARCKSKRPVYVSARMGLADWLVMCFHHHRAKTESILCMWHLKCVLNGLWMENLFFFFVFCGLSLFSCSLCGCVCGVRATVGADKNFSIVGRKWFSWEYYYLPFFVVLHTFWLQFV